MYIHEYFNRKHTEWSITGFLNECNEEPFRFKVDIYLKSLVNIINSDQGKKREKAQALFDKYKMACENLLFFFFIETVDVTWWDFFIIQVF